MSKNETEESKKSLPKNETLIKEKDEKPVEGNGKDLEKETISEKKEQSPEKNSVEETMSNVRIISLYAKIIYSYTQFKIIGVRNFKSV